MHRTLLLSLAMLTLAARPAEAGPSAQFRIDPLPGAKIQGLPDKESRAFFSGVEALSAHLAAIPAINAPAAPVCIALQREVFRYPMTPKQAEGKVYVSYLVPMSGQTCRTAKIVNSSLPLSINLAPFAERNAAYDEDEAGRMIAPQVYTQLGDGLFLIQYKKARYYVITRDREPALVPVSLERHLKNEERKAAQRMQEVEQQEASHREWLEQMHADYGPDLRKAPAAMRQTLARNIRETAESDKKARAEVAESLAGVRGRLASLSAEQRASPVCLDFANGNLPMTVTSGSCAAPRVALFALNPALTRPSKGLFRYLVVEALEGRHSTEQEHNFHHRTELLKQLDFSALASVFRAAGK